MFPDFSGHADDMDLGILLAFFFYYGQSAFLPDFHGLLSGNELYL